MGVVFTVLTVGAFGSILAHFQLKPKLIDEIVEKQLKDLVLRRSAKEVRAQQRTNYRLYLMEHC